MYGELPPVTPLIVMLPLSDPQAAFAGVAFIAVGPPELLISTFTLNSHPFPSFTVTVWRPAARLE